MSPRALAREFWWFLAYERWVGGDDDAIKALWDDAILVVPS